MADQDGLTIETEPAKGLNEFGPVGTDTKTLGLTEDELRERAAAFDEWFGVTAPVTVKDVLEHGDTELVRSTKESLVRAAVRAEEDRADHLEQQKLFREASAASGGWVPGNPSEAQSQELQADYQRRQGWTSLIEGGKGSEMGDERTVSQTWLEAEATRIKSADIAVAVEDIPLALAYYNGRREAFNSAREDFIENHPERAKDLPGAIEVDEIRVRQQVMEQEQKDRSLEIA